MRNHDQSERPKRSLSGPLPRMEDARQPVSQVPSGLYVLVIRLCCDLTVRVGALGERAFAAGWYLYVGSARSGLRARVERHRRKQKRLRWHIDYLTTQAECEVVHVVEFVAPRIGECGLCRALREGLDASVPVPGFGASDCTGRCGAHLLSVASCPEPDLIRAAAAAQAHLQGI